MVAPVPAWLSDGTRALSVRLLLIALPALLSATFSSWLLLIVFYKVQPRIGVMKVNARDMPKDNFS